MVYNKSVGIVGFNRFLKDRMNGMIISDGVVIECYNLGGLMNENSRTM